MGAQYFVEECGNLNEWQSFVDDSALGNIFQTKDWAKAMLGAGWRNLLLVARDRTGNISGGLLSFYIDFSFLGLKIVPTISAVGGPIVYDLNDNDLLDTILSVFDVKARKIGALHSFLRSFFPLDQILLEHLNYRIERDRLPCTVIVDLTRPTEELWKDLNKNARWGVRKAERTGVVVREGRDLHDVFAYYQIHVQTCRRLKIPPASFLAFKSVWNTLSSGNNVKLFLAVFDGKPIAGNIVLRWRDKAWAWHGASLERYWRLHPNQFVEWHSIKWAKENDAKTYDFLGIPCKKDNRHPKYGLYLYKTQYGGEIVRQGEYLKRYFPLRSILFKQSLSIYARVLGSRGRR